MDKERFGRALGGGTREAARFLVRAADAALAPDPKAPRVKAVQAATTRGVPEVRQAARRAFWVPAARATGVLWLEVTGSFFGLLALTMGVEVWRRRFDLRTPGDARDRALIALAGCAIFFWFTVSSFVRASRRNKS